MSTILHVLGDVVPLVNSLMLVGIIVYLAVYHNRMYRG
jgi:hypothetical protein